MEFLLVLLVFGFITVAGHFVWVILAAVVRAFIEAARERPARRPASPKSEYCPGCDTLLTEWVRDCPACGLERYGSLASQLRELDTSSRQVRALCTRGEIDEATKQRLTDLFRARRRVLLGKPPPVPHEVAPVPIPEAPLPAPPITEAIRDALPLEAAPAVIAAESVPAPPPPPPPPPPEPQRVTNVLSAFMENRNILWGELVGGLLIVGCSIALVLTLWNSLQALPYFPFLLFSALTACLFAAGQYTLHHWKLQSTSRGLLVIAMLLAPLNILILADPSARGAGPESPWVDLVIGVLALGVFLGLVRASGRDLIGVDVLPGPIDRRWLLSLAIVGAAGSQLLTPHLLDAPRTGLPVRFFALVGLPGAFHLLGCGAVLGGLTLYGRRERLHAVQANALFTFLGLATFALLASFGFLLSRLVQPAAGLHLFACPLILAGVPGLAAGLLVHRRLESDDGAGLRTAGTGVALAGLGLMLTGVVLAWPAPGPLLGALLLTGGVLSAAAFLARAPWAHAAGIPCLTLAVLVVYHLATGQLPAQQHPSGKLVRLLTSADSALILAGVGAVLAGLAEWLHRTGPRDQALSLWRASIVVGGTAIVLVTRHGDSRPWTAAGVHALGVVVGLLSSLRWRSAALAHVAAVLLIPGTLWALTGVYPQEHAWWATVLAVQALTLGVAAWVLDARGVALLPTAIRRVGNLTGALALLLAVFSQTFPQENAHTVTAFALSLALLTRALERRSPGWFTAFQAGLMGTVVCLVAALVYPQDFFADASGLQICGAGLGLLSLGWVFARRTMVDRPAQVLLPTTWIGLDRATLAGLVLGQLGLACVGALPGILLEWSPDPDVLLLEQIHGPGAWLLLGVTAAGLLAMLLRPARADEVTLRVGAPGGLMLLAVTATVLWAEMHAVDRATASALRWGLAACFLAGSALVWMRQQAARLAERVHLASAPATVLLRRLLAATAGVVVSLTVILADLGFRGADVPGPAPQSIFARMGSVLSSMGPLVLVIAGLVGTAGRERSAGYALAAGLLASVSAMGGYALGVVQSGETFDESAAVFTLLLGCQVAGMAALAWLACLGAARMQPQQRQRIGRGPLLTFQAWLGLLGTAALAVVLAPELMDGPARVPENRFLTLGGPAGWLALLISAAAAFVQTSLAWPRRRIHVVGVLLLGAGVLAGSLARQFDTPTLWASYHVLTGFWSVLAVGIVAVGSAIPLRTRSWQVLLPGRRVRLWLGGLAILLTLLALHRGATAATRPWSPIEAALAASVLTGATALWYRHGGFAHASGLLFTLATFLTWVSWGPALLSSALLSIVIGLALAAAFWEAIALPGLRIDVASMRWPGAPFSPLATRGALALLAVVVVTALIFDAHGAASDDLIGHLYVVTIGPLGWAAALAVGLALTAALGDARNRLARPGLYFLGLLIAGLFLHGLSLSPSQLAWTGALALGVHALLASLAVWGWQSMVEKKHADNERLLTMPDPQWSWLLLAQGLVAALVALLGFGVAIGLPSLSERLMGPLALALLVPSLLLLRRVAPTAWPQRQCLAMICGTAALAALAWAVPDPAGAAPWLERNAWLLAALTVACAVGLEGLPGWQPSGLVLGGTALLLVPILLSQMGLAFDPTSRRTPLTGPGVAAVALALTALVALALRLALQPGLERTPPKSIRFEPLPLSDRGRTACVYLAEVLLVFLFLHLRLNVPELFMGFLARYWTLVVLLLAFLGVGLSELCERRGLRVLAGPLQQTGVFLPLIPLLAFWARPPAELIGFADENAPGLRPLLEHLRGRPRHYDWYAFLWFLTTGVYGMAAVARRSTAWAVAAALAANFGLWALYLHVGLGFLVHPQAWLIPLGAIVLASEALNRDRLRPEAAQALRYLGISLIYTASTADLFLTGLGNSVWLPIVLAVLCVAGVLAGVWLHVRAFLFLGVGFLLVDVVSMIWLAAVEHAQTWLWWACGIVLGAAILALFAVFEKRRNDVLELLDGLRRWD